MQVHVTTLPLITSTYYPDGSRANKFRLTSSNCGCTAGASQLYIQCHTKQAFVRGTQSRRVHPVLRKQRSSSSGHAVSSSNSNSTNPHTNLNITVSAHGPSTTPGTSPAPSRPSPYGGKQIILQDCSTCIMFGVITTSIVQRHSVYCKYFVMRSTDAYSINSSISYICAGYACIEGP
jgi:hypothetical protein